MLDRLEQVYREYPQRFWVLVGAAFIDTVGSTALFPYFSLYVTQRFQVGMTEAGLLVSVFSLSGLVGSTVGGALTDQVGRRQIILFGLVFSALSTLCLGFVSRLSVLFLLAAFVGLLSNVAGPAHGAIVADLLPEQQRSEGFGMIRVAGNMAWIIGPTIGGFLAARSYLSLFILDCVISLITAGIAYRFLPETQPVQLEGRPNSIGESMLGYRVVLRDRVYVAFLAISMFMLVAYQQLYSTLSVFLRDWRGVPAHGYGLLLSINAGIVVVLQFWVTRRTKRFPPALMMALGSALYLIGLSMYGFFSAYALFVLAMLVITAGEMIVVPVGQALAASLAPEDMRGRYMATYGLSWAIPSAVAGWAGGLILDNYNPNWLWYAAGIACAVATAGFVAFHLNTAPHRARAAEKTA